MRYLMFAELDLSPETLFGGGIAGLSVYLFTTLVRRTKDVDERRDELARIAFAREGAMSGERDRALVEVREVRERAERQREAYERELDEQRAAYEAELKALREERDARD